MVANTLASSDNRLYENLIGLKRHLMICKQCRPAIKGNDPYAMCKLGITFVMMAAKHYDVLVSLRISAHNSDTRTVFSCPRLSAHGKTYELTAVPVVVVGYQDRLL